MKNKIGIIVLFTLQALVIPFALLAGVILLFSIVSLIETDWTQIKLFIQSIVALITMLIGVSYLGTYTFSLIKTVNNKKVSLISWLPVLHIIVSIIVIMVWGNVNQSFWMPGDNSIIASLPQPDTSDCYYSEGFQDYTDYCKYYYVKQENILEEVKNSPYFKPVTPGDITELNSYFDNFEGWLEYVDYKKKYDFQRNYIDTKDYYYIENDEISEKHKYWDYDVYFFDVQTQTLFYIHNNI